MVKHTRVLTGVRGLIAVIVGLAFLTPDHLADQGVQAQATGPVRLTHDLAHGETLGAYVVSPDGSRVAYQVGLNNFGGVDLYAASTTSGQPVKLTPAPLNSVRQVMFAGNSRVIYWIDTGWFNPADQLFSVPVTGGTPVPLIPVSHARRDIEQVAISPDGANVIVSYDVSSPASSTFNLYSIPADGSGSPRQLNGPLPTSGRVNAGWVISPVGPRVVYVASERSATTAELFSRRLDGSDPGPVVLNAALPAGANVRAVFSGFGFPGDFTSALALTPNGQRVVFVVDTTSLCCGQPTSPTQLFAAQVDAPDTATRLNRDGQNLLASTQALRMSPDGSRVAFLIASDTTSNFRSLASAPLAGPPGSDVTLLTLDNFSEEFQFVEYASADQVLYGLANGPVNPAAPFRLYAIAGSGGSTPRPLTAPDRTTARVVLAADRQQAVYVSDPTMLYAVPVTGTFSDRRVIGPPGAAGFQVDLANNDRLVFSGGSQRRALYTTTLDAPPMAATRLTANAIEGIGLDAFTLSTDGTRLIYRSTIGNGGMPALLSISTAPGQATTAFRRITGVTWPFTGPQDYTLSSDGRYALFQLTPQSWPPGTDLYSVALPDGIPVPLTYNALERLSVQSYRLTPDGARVVFTVRIAAVASQNDRTELYSVPIAGGAWTRLTPTLGPGREVRVFEPFGDQVLYLADQNQDEVFELFVVPADGSAGARQVGPALLTGQQITSFAPSPDTTRVAFVANLDSATTFDLFSQALNAGAPAPLKISAPLAIGVAIETYNFGSTTPSLRWSRDGQHVLYSTFDAALRRRDLYVAVAAGPASAARQLTDPQALGTSTSAFFANFSTDGSRLFFMQTTTVTQPSLIWSVPISASFAAATPISLNPPGHRASSGPALAGPGRVLYEILGAGPGATSLLIIGPEAGPAADGRPLYGGPVYGYQYAATGFVVFGVREGGGLRAEAVYSVAADGSETTPRRLAPQAGQTPSLMWNISADGKWMIAVSPDGLLVTPVMPSLTPPVLLSGALPEGVIVSETWPRSTPNGERVIFGITEGNIRDLAISAALPPIRVESRLFLPALSR